MREYSVVADKRHVDLMKQGCMKPHKKRRQQQRSASENAKILSEQLGAEVIPARDNLFAVPHPDGHFNYMTLTDAKKFIRRQTMDYSIPAHDRPLADHGLTSYRYWGQFGWIMIGAHCDEDALQHAKRSMEESSEPTLDRLQVWSAAHNRYINAKSCLAR